MRVPVISKELRTTRVPVQVNAVQVAYVEDLQWVDTPDRLFQDLLAETIRRTTSRVVLDPQQAALDPGVCRQRRAAAVRLRRASAGSWSCATTRRWRPAAAPASQTRRFLAELPADGTAATVGPALNRAANQVALAGRAMDRRLGLSRLFDACSKTSFDSPGDATIRSSSARISAARFGSNRRQRPSGGTSRAGDLRVELVGGEDHVGEEAVAAPVGASGTPTGWPRSCRPARAAGWGWRA